MTPPFALFTLLTCALLISALPTGITTVNSPAPTIVLRQNHYPLPLSPAPTGASPAPEDLASGDEGVTYNIIYTTTRFRFPQTICNSGSEECLRSEDAERTVGSLETVVVTSTSISYATPRAEETYTRLNAFDHPFEAAKEVPTVPIEARPIDYDERVFNELRDGELVDPTGVKVFGFTVLGYGLLSLAFWFGCRYRKFRILMGSREDEKPVEEEEDRRYEEAWKRKEERKDKRRLARRRAKRKEEKKKGPEWRESEATLAEVPAAVLRPSLREADRPKSDIVVSFKSPVEVQPSRLSNRRPLPTSASGQRASGDHPLISTESFSQSGPPPRCRQKSRVKKQKRCSEEEIPTLFSGE